MLSAHMLEKTAYMHTLEYVCCNKFTVLTNRFNVESRQAVVSREAKKKQHAQMFPGLRDHYN